MRGIHITRRRIESGTNGMLCSGGLKNCRMDIFLRQALDRPAGPLPDVGPQQSIHAGFSLTLR